MALIAEINGYSRFFLGRLPTFPVGPGGPWPKAPSIWKRDTSFPSDAKFPSRLRQRVFSFGRRNGSYFQFTRLKTSWTLHLQNFQKRRILQFKPPKNISVVMQAETHGIPFVGEGRFYPRWARASGRWLFQRTLITMGEVLGSIA